MGVDDLFSTESAVVAAATAAVCSPRARETLRRGVVFGVAGALKLGDVVTGAARGAARGVRGADSEPAGSDDGDRPQEPSAKRATGASRARRAADES